MRRMWAGPKGSGQVSAAHRPGHVQKGFALLRPRHLPAVSSRLGLSRVTCLQHVSQACCIPASCRQSWDWLPVHVQDRNGSSLRLPKQPLHLVGAEVDVAV